MIVVDTSILAHLVLDGDSTPEVVRVRQLESEWCAPLLWRSELRNVLATHVRLEQLEIGNALRAMELAEVVMRRAGYAVDTVGVLELAAQSGCSAYDCEFVSLARELGLHLVTLDGQLLQSFGPLAVSPSEFVTAMGS